MTKGCQYNLPPVLKLHIVPMIRQRTHNGCYAARSGNSLLACFGVSENGLQSRQASLLNIRIASKTFQGCYKGFRTSAIHRILASLASCKHD
mmetsp:Transcript_32673/g.61406  ORF Transcript_32673/g.61406 Transcript_32673/m.61406 type:complete len:92 (-) Transcript_32673:487-762(-)